MAVFTVFALKLPSYFTLNFTKKIQFLAAIFTSFTVIITIQHEVDQIKVLLNEQCTHGLLAFIDYNSKYTSHCGHYTYHDAYSFYA